MKPTCWIELRYGWEPKGVTVGQTGNPQLLGRLRATLLAEAERRAKAGQRLDPVLGFIHEQELKKLRDVLDILIPEGNGEPETIVSTRN